MDVLVQQWYEKVRVIELGFAKEYDQNVREQLLCWARLKKLSARQRRLEAVFVRAQKVRAQYARIAHTKKIKRTAHHG